MAFSCFAKSPQPGSSRRGSASPLVQDSNRKLPKLEPAVDYDNDFGNRLWMFDVCRAKRDGVTCARGFHRSPFLYWRPDPNK